ncbi:MAG: restriction endonuclease subunit S [Dehalococcoidales bacterium]|nr:restriction endonuclease subunit S [Dehalococcoidales bacterium]
MGKWEMVRLGDIANFNMGQSPPSESYNDIGKGIPFFQGKSDFGLIHPAVRSYCSDPKKTANTNDILISVRAPVGAINIANKRCCIGRGLAAISQLEDVSNYKYLYRYLQYKEKDIANMGVGSTFKAISKNDLDKIKIPLPPLSVQQQIADALDRASALIDKRKAQIAKLDLLMKSQFAEMFGDPIKGPSKWTFVKLGDVGIIASGSTPKTNVTENWGGNHKWITPAELNNDALYIMDSERHLTDIGIRSAGLKPFPAGTVLLSSRAPIGKVAISGDEMYCNQGFKNIICSDKIAPIFLYWSLKQNSDYLNSLGRGATFKEISKIIVENIKIALPPLSLQNQFANFVQQVEAQKSLFRQSLVKLKLNYKSLMQKCFRGEIF